MSKTGTWTPLERALYDLHMLKRGEPDAVVGPEQITKIMGVLKDQQRRIKELEQLACTDPLTGLHNRREFDEVLARVLANARRHQYNVALLLVDLDGFKQINDTHGHPAGDQALRDLAGLLKRDTRTSDLVARLGGDEFAVIFDHVNLDGVQTAVRRLVERVRAVEVFVNPTTRFHLHASIGACYVPYQYKPSAQELYAAADHALYTSKDTGTPVVLPISRIPGAAF